MFIQTEGNTPSVKSPLDPVLFMTLPQGAIVQDASLPVLTLLRILHAISRYWGTLYPAVNYKPLLPSQVRKMKKKIYMYMHMLCVCLNVYVHVYLWYFTFRNL